MTAKMVADAMGHQFIAVGIKGQDLAYSGSADKFKGYCTNRKVVEIIAPKNENSATTIYVS